MKNENWPEKLARSLNRLNVKLKSLEDYWENAEELKEELLGDEHFTVPVGFNVKEEAIGSLIANLNDMGKEDACIALVDIIHDVSAMYWNSELGFSIRKTLEK